MPATVEKMEADIDRYLLRLDELGDELDVMMEMLRKMLDEDTDPEYTAVFGHQMTAYGAGECGGSVLSRPHDLTLPHLAGEWTVPGADFRQARIRAATRGPCSPTRATPRSSWSTPAPTSTAPRRLPLRPTAKSSSSTPTTWAGTGAGPSRSRASSAASTSSALPRPGAASATRWPGPRTCRRGCGRRCRIFGPTTA